MGGTYSVRIFHPVMDYTLSAIKGKVSGNVVSEFASGSICTGCGFSPLQGHPPALTIYAPRWRGTRRVTSVNQYNDVQPGPSDVTSSMLTTM